MIQWLPIKTAPKDRRILLYWEKTGWRTGEWKFDQFWCDDIMSIGINIKPTHWAELPEEPP